MSAISASVEMVLGEINTNNAKATAYAVAFVYILLLTKNPHTNVAEIWSG